MTQALEKIEQLTPSEAAELDQCEAVIREGLRAFYETGRALDRIREAKLYRAEYGTFDNYMLQRWGLKRNAGYHLIYASRIYSELEGKCEVLPQNANHARHLVRVPEENRPTVWNEIVRTAPDGKITSPHVEAVAQRLCSTYTRQAAPPTQGVDRLRKILEVFARNVRREARLRLASERLGVSIVATEAGHAYWVKLRGVEPGAPTVRMAKAFNARILPNGSVVWRVQFEDATSVPLDQVERFATEAEIQRAKQ